jgi:ABC-type lipoprotein export system ATPase subunit
VVVLDAVTKIYGNGPAAVVALSDVTVRLAEGRCYAVIGPARCGKSALLRCVAGVERPTHGTVWRDRTSPIVADEPRGGYGWAVLRRLRMAAETGQTALLATSDPVVAACADVVLVLEDGHVADTLAGASPDVISECLSEIGGPAVC